MIQSSSARVELALVFGTTCGPERTVHHDARKRHAERPGNSCMTAFVLENMPKRLVPVQRGDDDLGHMTRLRGWILPLSPARRAWLPAVVRGAEETYV